MQAIAHAALGRSLCTLGRYREAESEFRLALELDATCLAAHLGLGTMLRGKGQLAASEAALRRAVQQDPRDAQALASLGLTLSLLPRLAEARECFEKALRLQPRDAGALCGLGRLARLEGRFADAERFYRSALEHDPLKAAAWAPIPQLRKMTMADKDWLRGAKRTLASKVPPLEESQLRFGMGKYFDDLDQFSRAFEQFKRANELRKGVAAPYDRGARSQFVSDLMRIYTHQRLTAPRPGASASPRPVFVVGMMRSGTTLVAQIIGSHPKGVVAGELDFWHAVAHTHETALRRGLPDAASASKLAEAYLKLLARHSADAQRVVDKSTFNTDCLGLIHCVLPRARFVHLRRDPIDTCLSCYFHDLANAASFTLDLSDLAHYYREYHRLMAHWRAELPAGVMLEIPYAELVSDQETWTRKIIEFIGLEWDPRCLEFHTTQGPVLTASGWQVRQRLYGTSIGRWKHYRKFIGPLLPLHDLGP